MTQFIGTDTIKFNVTIQEYAEYLGIISKCRILLMSCVALSTDERGTVEFVKDANGTEMSIYEHGDLCKIRVCYDETPNVTITNIYMLEQVLSKAKQFDLTKILNKKLDEICGGGW